MADVSITAANVVKGSGAQVVNGVLGATITAGETVYQNSSGAWIAAEATSLAASLCGGIALNGGSTGQPVQVLTGGPLTAGGTLVVGGVYVVSPNNAGGIAPIADISTGNYVTILGVATSASVLNVQINQSSTAHA